MAARAICSIEAEPSDQWLWLWQSPRRASRYGRPASPRGTTVVASSSTIRSGTSPASAWVITAPVLFPIPGRSVRVPPATRAASSSGVIPVTTLAALRKALILFGSASERSIR
jgi:hypothetical protein